MHIRHTEMIALSEADNKTQHHQIEMNFSDNPMYKRFVRNTHGMRKKAWLRN